jgi:hypothetical protein
VIPVLDVQPGANRTSNIEVSRPRNIVSDGKFEGLNGIVAGDSTFEANVTNLV